MKEIMYGRSDDDCRQRDQGREPFSRVREYVAAHLDSRLDVDALARIVGMSVSQFSRSFHEAVGLPPHTYVIHCRVMRAQELLANTQLPLIEIALTTGFSDQAHFSRRFHELTGVPPGAFRRLRGVHSSLTSPVTARRDSVAQLA